MIDFEKLSDFEIPVTSSQIYAALAFAVLIVCAVACAAFLAAGSVAIASFFAVIGAQALGALVFMIAMSLKELFRLIHH